MSDEKFDWGSPTVGIEKPEKDPATVDEMRQAIERARRDSGLISNVIGIAHYKGMSGEDKYAMLAYHALRQLEATHKQLLQMLYTTPSKPLIIDPNAPEQMPRSTP